VKTGISGQDLNQNGTSPRANSQVNKWNDEAGYEKYGSRVYTPDEVGASNRSEAKQWEQQNTDRLDSENHTLEKQSLPKPSSQDSDN